MANVAEIIAKRLYQAGVRNAFGIVDSEFFNFDQSFA